MTKLTCITPDDKGELVIAGEPLGRGGEGSVYRVISHNLSTLPKAGTLVAKIYHKSNEQERMRKIVAMIKRSPDAGSVAWPLAILQGLNGFVGYVMPLLAQDDYRIWAELAHPQQRKETADGFDVRYAITASLNLAITISAVHDQGHCLGDINESNIFVGADASVMIVDTDSAQINAGGGKVFNCLVGKPEFTAPELSHGSLADQERTTQSDVFGYAVAIYQLLVGGAHPTDGIYKGEGDPPTVIERIRSGVYPSLKKIRDYEPAPRIPSEALPKQLKELFTRAFALDPYERPSLDEFMDGIETVLDHLKQCKKVKEHWYDSRDGKCGWCKHVNSGQLDVWTLNAKEVKGQEQKRLNPVKFKSKDEQPKAKRGKASQAAQAAPRASSFQLAAADKPLSESYISKRIEMDKYKGRTLLNFVDGRTDVRPPLGDFIQSNPKLAYRCFVNELPSIARISWRLGDKPPVLWHLVLGLVLATAVSLSWFMIVPMLFSYFTLPAIIPQALLVDILAPLASITAALGSLAHFLSALRESRAATRVVGNLDKFPKASVFSTTGGLMVKGVVYGLPLLIALFGGVVFGLISFLSAAAKADK